ncbi:MAG: hypothetical protein ACRC2R_08140 [Xenococcaceae cyanobacterium]
MSFRKPITTFGGLILWNNIQQNTYFIIQEHKIGFPAWPYRYRILMRENRMEIASSNDLAEIEMDWRYLEDFAVPQLNEKIDVYGEIKKLDPLNLVIDIIKKFI